MLKENSIDYKKLKLGKNGIPAWDGLAYPTLLVINDAGTLIRKEIRRRVIKLLYIPEELTQVRYKNGNNILADRIDWAYWEMTMAGLLDRPARATYQITKLGKKILKEYGPQLDVRVIHSQKPFLEYKEELEQRNKRDGVEVKTRVIEDTENSSENIAELVTAANNAVATELLARIQQAEPSFFETLVVKLLSAMGYQGDDGTAIITQSSGDSGIDGIINQAPLGTSTVYIQAKRYKKGNTVARPEIDGFYGALAGRNASRGVFITTSKFTSGAQEQAKKFSIVLIDGIKLTKLMLKYRVGVQVKASFDLFEVDDDFFE